VGCAVLIETEIFAAYETEWSSVEFDFNPQAFGIEDRDTGFDLFARRKTPDDASSL
jgi:hypothetical protein